MGRVKSLAREIGVSKEGFAGEGEENGGDMPGLSQQDEQKT